MAERSLTGYAIAKATGMSFAQVYRVLKGENTSVNCVQDICKAVGLNLTVTKAACKEQVMARYIDKDAVVVEMEKRIKEHHSGYLVCLKDILSFINTLEVKEFKG